MAAHTEDPASLRTSRRRFLIATASSAALPVIARTVSSESAHAKEFRDSGGTANVALRNAVPAQPCGPAAESILSARRCSALRTLRTITESQFAGRASD